MSATLTLDRFELLWYVEGFVGGSHLRWSGYETMVDKVYPQLNDDERECIYTYAKRDLANRMSYEFKNNTTAYQYWCQFLARYNPANQYKVALENGNEKQTVDAYKWNNRYYTDWRRYCGGEFIKSVEQKPFKKCAYTFEMCCMNKGCVRNLTYKQGDEVISPNPCDGNLVCDYLVSDREDGCNETLTYK